MMIQIIVHIEAIHMYYSNFIKNDDLREYIPHIVC